ncbi:hypothetical protein NDU88_004989 [Pleurodeles waltl]|uniref:Uncharacterized protein n=1 Tax=Pleurodeles waltl TaxID=8319 RepID=A0AAV7NL19_PLEWA|nr:hypothetical protein NDU88_004989 [Pleurodeles waltl]
MALACPRGTHRSILPHRLPEPDEHHGGSRCLSRKRGRRGETRRWLGGDKEWNGGSRRSGRRRAGHQKRVG